MQRFTYEEILVDGIGCYDFRDALLRNLILKENKWGLKIDFDERLDISTEFFDVELKINGHEFDVKEWFYFWRQKWEEDNLNFKNLVKREAEKMLVDLNLKQFDEALEVGKILDGIKKDILNTRTKLIKKCNEALDFQFPKIIDRYFDQEIECKDCKDMKFSDEMTHSEFIDSIKSMNDIVWSIKQYNMYNIEDSEECRRLILSFNEIDKLKKRYEEYYEVLKKYEDGLEE